MAAPTFELLARRRFLPLFITQFLGAMNDNVLKNALVILVIYRLADAAGLNGQILATVAAGIFILPFFLFSATAGQLADRLDKKLMTVAVKASEVVIMLLAIVGFVAESIFLLMTALFLMGVHSTFFGPIKYGILPAHLGRHELLAGNALIEAGTFLAILIGTILGGVLILLDGGVALTTTLMLAVALGGLASSLYIPNAPPPAPDLALDVNLVRATVDLLAGARRTRAIWLSIMAISWFWLVGATFLSQFPAFAKDVLGADEHIVTLFLTVFSVGIGLGSLLCNRLLRGLISATYVPLGALGMAIFGVDLFFASAGLPPRPDRLLTIGEFLAHVWAWRIVIDLLLVAVFGGIYIVPLYAILQSEGEESHRSRLIAANNVVNAAFMVAAALITSVMLALEVTVPQVFLIVSLLNLVALVVICRILPDALVKSMIQAVLRLLYRVEITGIEHARAAGPRVLYVVNHVSFLDGLLLGAFLPEKPTFAINTYTARQWWVRPFLSLVDAFALDPTNPMATKALIRVVQEGRHCVIFPEGRITVTGALMKVYEGPGLVADKAGARIVPVRIDGAQYSPFSRLRGKVRLRWFPKITITLLPPRDFALPADMIGRQRRHAAGVKLYDVMAELMFETCERNQTLFQALLDARAIHGGSRPILEDVERKPISYDRLVLGSFVLGGRLARLAAPGARIGVLLPNSIGAVVVFFALQAFGRVPAMLNFSTGLDSMRAACKAAQIGRVLTSRVFIARAKLERVAAELSRDVELIYLDDLRAEIGLVDKLRGLVMRLFARGVARRSSGNPTSPAVVLFTSGSEGTPKGVALSHSNILANKHQLAARIDYNPTDIVFNALPIFHSFGLTGGLMLPLLSGIRSFLYPSPLHYRIVPELSYDTNATILFGTDTFLTGYARAANPYDFYSVRYVFAGAERVRPETRAIWADKFGLRILEGYGATETSPVLAANTPMHFKAGTVGRLLPGIKYRLDAVPGIETGGKLVVSGPNVMLGYLKVDNPGVVDPPADGWYDTGDIVEIDADGFVTIQGRAKRFAKIAGEMVSLAAVEQQAELAWPGHHHAAVALPDPRKGERVVLVTDHRDATSAAFLAAARERGVAEVMVPRTVVVVDKLPVLGTGKTDYVAVKKLAEEAREVTA